MKYILFLLGVALVIYGVALIYVPAALIVAGLASVRMAATLDALGGDNA